MADFAGHRSKIGDGVLTGLWGLRECFVGSGNCHRGHNEMELQGKTFNSMRTPWQVHEARFRIFSYSLLLSIGVSWRGSVRNGVVALLISPNWLQLLGIPK